MILKSLKIDQLLENKLLLNIKGTNIYIFILFLSLYLFRLIIGINTKLENDF